MRKLKTLANFRSLNLVILKSCQFESLSIDLMFSIPGQNLADWEDDLKETIALKPQHISAYNLNYEEDTEFFDRLKKGEFFEDPEKDGDHFSLAMKELTNAGYNHYETSNYALKGHQSKHNSSYWEGKDYLGVGPGAFSTVNRKRWRNVPDTKKYIDLLKSNTINMIETEKEIINANVPISITSTVRVHQMRLVRQHPFTIIVVVVIIVVFHWKSFQPQ